MKIEYGISYANVYNLEDVMLEAIKIRRSIRTYINKKVEEEKIEEMLKKYRKCQLVITDRLHGMIFAAITSTPCIALGN